MTAAVAAAKRLPTISSFYGRIRSIPCSLGRSVRRTKSEAGKAKVGDMIKLHGCLPYFLQAPNPFPKRLRGGRVAPPISIIEIKCYDSPAPLVNAEARELNDISVRRYSTQSINANANVFLDCLDKKGLGYFTVSSIEEDGTISLKSSIYPPSPLQKDCVFLGATFNGLFHFHRSDWDHLLWNSKTNEIKTLPQSFVAESDDALPGFDDFALCLSSSQQDYILLQVLETDTLDEQGRFKDSSYLIWLYSLKSKSWKTIPCTQFTFVLPGSSVCINEVCYCKSFSIDDKDEDKETHVILSFDFSTEALSSLPLPPNTTMSDAYCILDYKGFLSVAVYSHDEDVPSKYELWVMIGGSWTRETVLHVRGVHHPVWFSKNGRLLYFEGFDSQVVVFDRDVGKFKNLGCQSYHGLLKFYPFGESSVRLNGV